MRTSIPRSAAMPRSFANSLRSSPVTISEPQCVMIACGTPSFSHHVSWVRTGEWPMRLLPSNKRTRYSGAIANVNLHIFQRRGAIMDKNEIRNIKNTHARSAYAISDRRGKNGMFDWERFECDQTNLY